MKRLIGLILLVLIVSVVSIGVLAGSLLSFRDYCLNISFGSVSSSDYNGESLSNLTEEQTSNAYRIWDISNKRNDTTPRDAEIGIITAYQESRLINLDYGDRDSLGLFQQRPSQGWGTPQQIMDPDYSINKFFDVLVKITDRESMSENDAAQAVQRSGFPDAYGQWLRLAKSLVDQFGSASPDGDSVASFSIGPINFQGFNCSATNSFGGNVIAGGEWALPLDNPQVGSKCGLRLHPIDGGLRMHDGEDFPAPSGTKVYAIKSGTVKYIGYDGSYGNSVQIDHGGGLTSRSAHLSAFEPGLVEGSTVEAGQVIGYVGTTGYSTGDHLHLNTIIDGTPVRTMELIYSGGESVIKCESQDYSYN